MFFVSLLFLFHNTPITPNFQVFLVTRRLRRQAMTRRGFGEGTPQQDSRKDKMSDK